MKRLLRSLRSLLRADGGIAYVEFAIALPFLLALFLGAVDVTRYILITQKVEKVSVTVSDLVAQYQSMSTSQLNNLIIAAGQVMQPYPFGASGYVIVTSVTKTGTNQPVVNWQYTGGGSWTKPSRIGTPGAQATLPAGFTMNDKDNIIIAEVFYNYAPLIVNGVVSQSAIYRTAIYRPRLGALNSLS